MWIKLTGILFILTAGTGIGWAVAARYIYRVNYLQELYMAVNLINSEIVYKQTVLPEALKKTADEVKPPVSELLLNASIRMQEEKDSLFTPLWKDILSTAEFHPEDKKIMIEWGKNIGSTRLPEQEKNNKITMKKIAKAEERAEKIADKKVKLSRYAGVLISFLLIILCY